MKVLHFVDCFLKPTETFIKRYVQKGMQFADVAIATFDFVDVPADIEQHVTLYKINNPHFSRKNLAGVVRYLREKITGEEVWYSDLNNAINEFNPDIIHCHFGYMGVFLMEFKRRYPTTVPYVTTIYAFDITSLPIANAKYGNKLNKLWMNGNAFFVEGPALLKKVTAFGCPEAKCLINPLLIPVNEYPVKTTYRNINDSIKFLFIGRFIEKKGLSIFLQAIGKIQNEINKFSIDIIGSGPMIDEYKKFAVQYNLEQFITWHGLVSHDKIIPMIKDYDFLIHPSLTAKNKDSEGGSSTIIIESEAVGLPIITTDHDDIPFVMGYDDFLAKENDVDSLIDVIKRIIKCNNIQHYASLGADKVYQLHDLKMNKTYEANLKKLVKY